jgi:hypothetical protein
MTFVNVRELILCNEALRWFLDQPVGRFAAYALAALVEKLIQDGIAPEPCAACMAVPTETAPDAHLGKAASLRL